MIIWGSHIRPAWLCVPNNVYKIQTETCLIPIRRPCEFCGEAIGLYGVAASKPCGSHQKSTEIQNLMKRIDDLNIESNQKSTEINNLTRFVTELKNLVPTTRGTITL